MDKIKQKFTLLYCILFFLCTLYTVSAGQIALDGFENGWVNTTGSWVGAWSHSTDGVIINESPYAGAYHARMHANGGYLQRAVNLSTLSGGHLKFAYKTRALVAGDYAFIDIYDGTWHSKVQTYNENDNLYRIADIDLASYNMISTFQIRFGLVCKTGRHYFYVDEVEFTGTAVTPLPPSPTPALTLSPSPTPTPTPTQPAAGAVLIQAEDYTAYFDTTTGNSGGMYRSDDVDIEVCHDSTAYSSFNIAWMANGEWLRYNSIFPATDYYTLYTRVASYTATGKYHMEIDGVDVTGTLTFAPTGGWQVWSDSVKTGIHIAAGSRVVRFVSEAADFNLNYFYFVSSSAPPAPTPPPARDWGTVPTAPPGYAKPVLRSGRLQVSGNRIPDQSGNPVQLRGWSSHGPQYFPYISEHTLLNLAYNHGINITRAAMYVEEGGYLFNQAYMKQKVNEMVADAVTAGVYVIIDWHIHGNPPDYTQEAIAFFTEMAGLWGSYPHILYEIVNEPVGGVSWSTIKQYADAVIPAIRAQDPDNLIIVGTPNWCQQPALAAADPIIDNNVCYSFHFYSGTHGDTEKTSLDQAMDAGLAVFCSEWGTSDYNETFNDFNKASAYIAFMEERSINWLHWSFSIKPEASSALLNTSSPAGPWLPGAFTQAGTFINQAITAPVLPYVYNSGITMAKFGPVTGAKYYAEATVKIVDINGNPVPGARVVGKWSGAAQDTDAGYTGTDGCITFQSDKIKNGGTFTFTLVNIVPTAKRWHPNFPGSMNANSITNP